jgi:hypothetical protein
MNDTNSATTKIGTRSLGLLDDARAWVADHFVAVVGIIAVALVAAGQLVEIAESSAIQDLPPQVMGARLTVIVVAIYLLFVVEVVRRAARDALAHLRACVVVDDAKFDAYAQRMAGQDLRLELALLAISTVTVAVLFPVLGLQLPTTNVPATFLPRSAAAALVVLVGYTTLGWAGLRLVARTIRLARALSQLTREKVEINVFDTTELLPFGRIALAGSLAPVGLIVIFLIGFGTPQTPLGFGVLLLATATSILALVLPLRGIHGQMRRAKDQALTGLNHQLTEIHDDVTIPEALDQAAVAHLNDRTSLLTSLRRVVGEMPTWPFRDTVAFGRAVLIASAPVIYALLNGLVDSFVVKKIAG